MDASIRRKVEARLREGSSRGALVCAALHGAAGRPTFGGGGARRDDVSFEAEVERAQRLCAEVGRRGHSQLREAGRPLSVQPSNARTRLEPISHMGHRVSSTAQKPRSHILSGGDPTLLIGRRSNSVGRNDLVHVPSLPPSDPGPAVLGISAPIKLQSRSVPMARPKASSSPPVKSATNAGVCEPPPVADQPNASEDVKDAASSVI